jgi:phenylacetate-coenzyme A ligase PaaK-like adenylate-forming protein
MLAMPEPDLQTSQLARVEKLLPRWRELAIYEALPLSGDFAQLPLITKADLRRDFPRNFLRPDQDLDALVAQGEVELEHTSGSSEERTAVLFGRGWWNRQEQQALRLNSFVGSVLDEYPHPRRATIVPPVCNGLVCFSNWASKSSRTVDATLFINQARIPFLNTEDELARMAAEVAEWSPQFLDLDPVHGAWFALYCERRGLKFPSVKFILCSYEFVSVVHRRIIERVFGVPVLNFYGSTETGHLLMEDDAGEMKSYPENVYYEVINQDERGIGDMIVTTLTNEIMPLVRYRVGDLVEAVAGGESYLVHGRSRDALLRADGQRVTTLDIDRCFAGVSGIAHYHLRQAESGVCHLQYVPDREKPGDAELNGLTARIREVLQLKTAIPVEAVNKLPPLTSGKFRLTSRS